MLFLQFGGWLYIFGSNSPDRLLSSRLSTGTAVEVRGVWKACPPGKEQTHELQATDVSIVGAADPQVRRLVK